MTATRVGEVVAEVFAEDLEQARRLGHLGYYARVLTQATLPHSRRVESTLHRHNGALTLTMAGLGSGLPYGSIPRLLLAWVSTEAVRTRDRRLVLGDHLAGFMRQVELVPTGGRWGTIPRLRSQMERLFTTAISVSYRTPEQSKLRTFAVADSADLWWNTREPHQAALWQSTVTLGEQFYESIIDRPIPIDMAALQALRRSPLALDLYTWLTYRMSYLGGPVTVPWPALAAQFGADYTRTRAFRAAVDDALAKVHSVYPSARVDVIPTGLRLRPSPTHIRKLH